MSHEPTDEEWRAFASTTPENLNRHALTAANAIRDKRIRAEALEETAAMLDAWGKPATLKLSAGEMTAQELRTVKAVLCSASARIRALKDKTDE